MLLYMSAMQSLRLTNHGLSRSLKVRDCLLSEFQLGFESNQRRLRFCFTSQCDWPKNLEPASRRINT